MLRKHIFFMLCLPSILFAKESDLNKFPDKSGEIAVLEAPLFLEANENSKVIKYYRKGEMIYIHPQHLRADAEKSRPKFFLTMDSQGRNSYILSKHIVLHYENEAAFEQKYHITDDTDYRLAEPLPKDYPFLSELPRYNSYHFALASAPHSIYPYTQDIKKEAPANQYQLSYQRLLPFGRDIDNRNYWGVEFNYLTYQNKVTLEEVKATEDYQRFAIGMLYQRTLWYTEKRSISLTSGILFTLFDTLTINQNTASGKEKNIFNTNQFIPKVDLFYRWHHITDDLGLHLGVNIEAYLPFFGHRSSSPNNQIAQWHNEGKDFSTQTRFHGSLLVGLHSTI